MTSALLAELIPETEALLDDILDEMEDPHVQRRGIMYLEPMEATVGTRRRSRPR